MTVSSVKVQYYIFLIIPLLWCNGLHTHRKGGRSLDRELTGSNQRLYFLKSTKHVDPAQSGHHHHHFIEMYPVLAMI